MPLNCGVEKDPWYLDRPLDCKEIQPVHPKGNQSWVFIGRTDAEAETPLRWPPDAKRWLTWKDPDAGTDWRWEKKGSTEDEMVGCHHWLNGHEFEQGLGVHDGQGNLTYCSPWGHKESDMTERLNWTANYKWHLWYLSFSFWHISLSVTGTLIVSTNSWGFLLLPDDFGLQDSCRTRLSPQLLSINQPNSLQFNMVQEQWNYGTKILFSDTFKLLGQIFHTYEITVFPYCFIMKGHH